MLAPRKPYKYPYRLLSQYGRHNWSAHPIAISPYFLIPCSLLIIEAENSQKPTMPTFLQLIMAHEAQRDINKEEGASGNILLPFFFLSQVCLRRPLLTLIIPLFLPLNVIWTPGATAAVL